MNSSQNADMLIRPKKSDRNVSPFQSQKPQFRTSNAQYYGDYRGCPVLASNCSSSTSSLEDTMMENASIRIWSGIIPLRTPKVTTYSQKIFLGGIPWDTSEDALRTIFGHFGNLRVEWPGKDNFSAKPKVTIILFN